MTRLAYGNMVQRALAFAVLAVLTCALPAFAQVRNITGENRAALDQAIERLQHTELMRVTRGRVKSNPVMQPHFTIYQSVLQNRDLLLDRQLRDYAAALGGMQRASEDFSAFSATPLGARATDVFYSRLVSAYLLDEELEKAGTLWEVWTALQISGYRMQALPVMFRMALNAGRWLDSRYNGAPPADIQDAFLALCQEDVAPMNIFDEKDQVDALSRRWSGFFARISGVAPADGATEDTQ